MTVYVGSARSDENGKANSGKAGDQKQGKEVSTQAWYKHSKGWRVFRAKDPKHALIIAKIMRWACKSDLIGYDQWNRHTLYNALKAVGFDLSKLTKKISFSIFHNRFFERGFRCYIRKVLSCFIGTENKFYNIV